MKQLTKDIMAQAGAYTDVSGRWANTVGMDSFLEFIVKECIDVIKPTEYHQTYPDNVLGGSDGIELLNVKIAQIRERFKI